MPRKRESGDRITAAKLKAAGWARIRQFWYCDGGENELAFDLQHLELQLHESHVSLNDTPRRLTMRTVTGWADLCELVRVLKGKAE